MKQFFKNHKNLTIILASVCLAAALAIALAFALADSAKVVFSDDAYLSYINESIESSVESTLSTQQPTVSEPQEPEKSLVITSPTRLDTTVSESHFAIIGTSDPQKPLYMNGAEVARLETGEFSVDVELAPGKNTFTFEHNTETLTCIIRYDYVVIKAVAPYENQRYEAGSSFVAVAYARVNSSVTATFNGQTITLSPVPYKEGDEFTNFAGTFTLPSGNETDIDLGRVTFTGVCNGVSKNFVSAKITCLRDTALDRPQIVEIVASQAETFNGDTTDDASRPTNSYLPQGTVDYRVGGIVYEPESGNSYYNLRCGKRVYITKKNAPEINRVTVSKSYEGELPETNTITLVSKEVGSKHTTLTLNTEWKAPFAVNIGPQNYTNPSKQDYTISSVTYNYVEIKFFYAQNIIGDYNFVDHPLFSSAELIPYQDGAVLRFYLKEVGAFYGWNAEYNSEGQLVFQFLNPPTVKGINDLTGLKIVIDAGHGGRDIGASGLRPDTMCEAERNLSLAYKLKAELESYGATVIMTRTADVAMSADARCEFLRATAPDLCISIHHDSSTRASASGGSFFCFNAFSDKATKYVYDRNVAEGFYSSIQRGWHYFYLARVTSCPVVLTENGFISNQQDFVGISSDEVNTRKAKAITQGVLDYFNSFVK